MAQSNVCIYPFPRRPELDLVYPIKVFEYLALGKVVVASRLTGVCNVIHDGKNGILFEPGDPASLADAILCVYRDQSLQRRIERVARDSVADFDWKLINQRILARLQSEHRFVSH